MLKRFLTISLLFIGFLLGAQELSNFKKYELEISNDTLIVDSLSILEESFQLSINGKQLSQNTYQLNPHTCVLIVPEEFVGQTAVIAYRTFPFLFTKRFYSKDFDQYQQQTAEQGFLISSAKTNNSNYSSSSLVDFGKLSYNGNLSRGIGFGNAQSLNVNSNFNIQLSGMITDDIEVLAAITDNNIPIQPEGNTAQLQEFDKVFIQLRKDKHYLTVGDFDLRSTDSYFMKFQRNMQGASYQGEQNINDFGVASGKASFAISRGKFVINNITAQEGNQGPYRLTGPNGETFIIVLGGSERVFINGLLQERGDNNDYVIDYNVGEITFTPNKMITQDMRIRVEFEYADRYYLRSLYHVNGGFSHDKFEANFNFFSQQDAKNQAINQDINEERTRILESAGDDILSALASGVSAVDFDESRVLYERRDTLINGVLDTFYVYSTNEELQLYSLTFSLVGEGNGSYSPINAVANGRVFEYFGPGNGAYLPVVQLIAPEKQQLFNTRIAYKLNKTGILGAEFSLSNRDLNTFSELDKEDNIGYGLNLFMDQQIQMKKDSLKSIQINGNYEFKQKDFTPLERYRAVEFNRNFSFQDDISRNEHLANVGFNLNKAGKGNINVTLNYLQRDSVYRGVESILNGNYNHKGWSISNTTRHLYAKNQDTEIHFIRPQFTGSKALPKIGNWRLGVTVNNEINQVRSTSTDSLLNTSFLWQEYGVFIQTADSSRNQLSLNYKLRYQHLSDGEQFDAAYLRAQNIEIKGRILAKKSHTLNWNLIYRNLKQDTLFTSDSDLEHFYLGRIDYGFSGFKGAIRGSTLYEIGAGREQEVQYNYIEDPNGLGSFAWEDINGNGVQEINEFYVSAFDNENRFIRVYSNSLQFRPVNSTRFNQNLNLNPKAVWFNEKGIKNLLSKFSSNTSLQFSKKVFASSAVDFVDVISPFEFGLADSVLVSRNTSIRNVLFFNRTDTKYGFDYTYLYSENKSLLTSGFERRKYILNTFNARWNFAKNFTLNGTYATGFKQNGSDFFFDRQYEYIINEAGGNITWLYKNALRIELAYQYGFKSNPLPETGGQFSVSNEMLTNIKYAKANNYSITGQFSYTTVGYNDESFQNQQLQFDMLRGLQEGNNFIWNIGIDKTFAKLLQLSVIYDGRKVGDNSMVHSGRMQVRAIF